MLDEEISIPFCSVTVLRGKLLLLWTRFLCVCYSSKQRAAASLLPAEQVLCRSTADLLQFVRSQMDQLSILFFLAIHTYFWKGCKKACTTLLPNPNEPVDASRSEEQGFVPFITAQAGNTFIIHPYVKTIEPGLSLPISCVITWVPGRVKVSKALRG